MGPGAVVRIFTDEIMPLKQEREDPYALTRVALYGSSRPTRCRTLPCVQIRKPPGPRFGMPRPLFRAKKLTEQL